MTAPRRPRYTDMDRYAHGYTSSGRTDIRRAFARRRAQLEAERAAAEANAAEAQRVVAPMKRRG